MDLHGNTHSGCNEKHKLITCDGHFLISMASIILAISISIVTITIMTMLMMMTMMVVMMMMMTNNIGHLL